MKHLLFFLITILALPALAQIPDAIPEEYARKYRRHERKIERAERKDADTIIRLDPIETFPITPTFYALETGNWGPTYLGVNQRADEIRSRARRKVVVFIFDTGGCYDHPLLKDVAWNDLGRSFTGEPCEDGHGHSTHVAGIIAAASPDFPLGVARMVDVKLVPIKVLSNQGSGSFAGIVKGTEYANGEARRLIQQGYFVVYNYSLGGSTASDALDNALAEAESMGVVVCAANGNTGKSPIQYPGRSDYSLGIAALAQSGSGVTRAGYSSYGPETWAAEPGSAILSTWKGGGTAILSGTSMATPHQAGIFAILGAVYPNATAQELKAHFVKYATDLGSPGRDEYYGYGSGIIDALLDNSPGGSEPEPEPPTCEDGKQNGKEKGIDCGGADCPPCEPEKPGYRARELPLRLSGNWVLRWWKVGAATSGAKDFNLEATALVSPAGASNITIKEIGFTAKSESTIDWELDALDANTRLHWRNRGLGTPEAWDVYDASRYILFFLDLHITRGENGYIRQALAPAWLVVEHEGKTVQVRPEDLEDYK